MKTSLFFQIQMALVACDEQRPAESKLNNVRARLLIILENLDPYRYKKYVKPVFANLP